MWKQIKRRQPPNHGKFKLGLVLLVRHLPSKKLQDVSHTLSHASPTDSTIFPYFFIFWPCHSMWDLSFLIRDQTWAPYSVSTGLNHGTATEVSIFPFYQSGNLVYTESHRQPSWDEAQPEFNSQSTAKLLLAMCRGHWIWLEAWAALPSGLLDHYKTAKSGDSMQPRKTKTSYLTIHISHF